MYVADLLKLISEEVKVIHLSDDADTRSLSKVFCCDLLSIAMSRAPADGVWITVMGNVNAVAVSVLTDLSLIILAEGAHLDETAKERAVSQGVSVCSTELPIFDIGLIIHHCLEAGDGASV